MSDTIFLVHASIVEYSDTTEWIVAWYTSLEDAERHAVAAGREASDLYARLSEYASAEERLSALRTPLDPFRATWLDKAPTYCVFPVERGKWPYKLPEAP